MAAREYKIWLPQEDNILIDMVRRRESIDSISETLGRSRSSIINRKKKLGVYKKPFEDEQHRKWREKAKRIAINKIKKELGL